MELFDSILNMLYPKRCMFCKEIIDFDSIYKSCGKCISSLPYTKNSGCFETLGGAQYLIAPLRYTGMVRRAIRDLKFHSKYDNATLLAQITAGYIRTNKDAMKSDLIINVPLSQKSLLRRGYNQTHLIASAISYHTGIEYIENALIKVRETKRQSSLITLYDRAINVENAYVCRADLSYKKILLVDDVYTSGMTVYSCANELIMAGASKVIAVAVATAHKSVGISEHNYKSSHVLIKKRS